MKGRLLSIRKLPGNPGKAGTILRALPAPRADC